MIDRPLRLPIHAAANGKLLLFGEHAAVYGYDALGLSLPFGLRVFLEPPGRSPEALGSISETESDGPGGDHHRGASSPDAGSLDPLFRVRAALRRTPQTAIFASREFCSLRIESDLPSGRGLGSSGALCAALAETVIGLTDPEGTPSDRLRVWSLAQLLEGEFHGTPSGIDTGLALSHGLIGFRSRPGRLPERVPLRGVPLYLLVLALPREGSTAVLISNLKERMRRRDMRISVAMRELGAVAAEAMRLFASFGASDATPTPGYRNRDIPKFGSAVLGSLASRAQDVLRTLGLSSSGVEDVLRAGIAGGALGGKLSGAGGGGAVYLVYGDEAALELGTRELGRFVSSRPELAGSPLYPLHWPGAGPVRLVDFSAAGADRSA